MPDDPSTQFDPRIETGSRARELPQEAHIRKRFEKFQDFIDMYRSRISLGGAFVDAQTLHPVGAEVYLDFRLEDGYRLLYGLGEVVWVRLVTMSDDRPKGMGLRFLSLDEGGRELVLKLLEEQVKSGGAPFEVDRVPEDGSIDPTVVQALAGPSAEENEAAAKARTGSRPARLPEAIQEEADEELPDLPPGVLPPPDDEPDFSAPWGEQLPEIPLELLEESATGAGASGPFLPSVEAPESPYAPGSDSHDDHHDDRHEDSHNERGQADLAFQAPPYDGDPHLDETDFGASAWDTSSEVASQPAQVPPLVKPLGDATNLLEARGGDPFSDFDGDSVPEVDGTLFQLPDAKPATSAPPSAAVVPETETAPETEPEPAVSEDPALEAPSFGGDAGTGFDAGFEMDSDAFDVDFGDAADDTASQVAPPPDIGDEVGSAWAEEPPETSAPSQSSAMDAALDIGGDEDDFAFEPPPEDVLSSVDEALTTDHGVDAGFGDAGFDNDFAVPTDDRADIATPAAIAAAALGAQMPSQETPPPRFDSPPTSPPERSFSSTETADDLFAFRGPADAQPALDPEETASLRKGALLPDLSETMMGTKSPSGDDTGGLHHSYDDWHEWAPHPAKSGGKAQVLISVLLVLALAGGAGYYFRGMLLPLIGLGTDGPSAGTDTSAEMASTDSVGSADIQDTSQDGPADDPLAEPIVVAEPDPGDAEPPSDTQADDSTSTTPVPPQQVSADESAVSQTANPPTTASAESLRPPPTRPETTRSTGRAAKVVEGIDVRPGTGATEVVVQFDGDISPARYQHDKLSWAADKEMVKLLGMQNFKQTQIAGDGTRLRQVRVGFHPGDELHLVFDLASGAVSIQGIEARGNQLVIRISN